MSTLTIQQVADELHMSERWLRDWLAANPMDVDGKLFYTPIGRRKEFEPSAADRIRNRLREIEECRLSSTGGRGAKSGITAEQLAQLAKESAFGGRPTLKTRSKQRIRFPSSNRNTGTVVRMVPEAS